MKFIEKKHNLEYANNMVHIKMFKNIMMIYPRYINESSGDKHPQIDTKIPIKKMLMPLQKI